MSNPQDQDPGDDGAKTVILSRAQMVNLAAPQAHYLVLTRGSQHSIRRELGAQPLLLGRSPDNDLSLDDRVVSGRHCRVEFDGRRVWVADLGSTNGTWVSGARIQDRTELPVGGSLQVGTHSFLHELRNPQEILREEELQADLQRAGAYLRSLLPPPMRAGPVQTNWVYEPAALLCGDAFGVHPVDADHLAFFLIDVSGHGAGAALHTATAINALRHRLLPGVDFRDPALVLSALNRTYPMERHGNAYFSIWYGVYAASSRTLRYASAGHPPALLAAPSGEIIRLHTQRLAIGLVPDETYETRSVAVPPGARLFVFSDGVYEVETPGGGMWSFNDFRDEVARLPAGPAPESELLRERVAAIAGTRELQDDFTLLVARFE